MINRCTVDFRTVLAGLLVAMILVAPVQADKVRIVVDTREKTLQVLNGKKVIKSFENIAIGRYGKTYFKQRGDNKTPLGQFRIGWVNNKSRYYRFLGLTYPDLATADRALVEERINEDQWRAIRRASRAGQVPLQNTSLGGAIGIHGLGRGDPEVHQAYNWTNGCVALTNEQIDQLVQWAKIGTPVEIR